MSSNRKKPGSGVGGEHFTMPSPGPNCRIDPTRDKCAEAAARSGCRDVLLALQGKGVAIVPGVPTVIQGTLAAAFAAGWDLGVQVTEERTGRGGVGLGADDTGGEKVN